MKLSIIIPTFNEEEYLPTLLKSIKCQNFKDYEIIVADANSTDNTKQIAEEYNCKVVEGGLPAFGRNNGAKFAKGEILLFLDSDLELTKGYLKNVVEEFENENLGIAITQMKAKSEKKQDRILHDMANMFMIAVENIKPHGAGCYGILAKKSLHDKFNGFNENLNFGEDTDYIERLASSEKFKVLRNAKVGVSTRRLEEEGLYKLALQYGKSTINDFRGKRTDANDIGYGFGHGKENKIKINSLENNNFSKNNVKYKKSINLGNTTIYNRHTDEKKIIFYSVCGEGMGHAIRSSVIIKHLKKKYNVYVFSSNRAYTYLKSKFDNVYEIGCFNTVYENNRVNRSKTFLNAMKNNASNLKEGYGVLYKLARKLKPNIIITDFENYASILANILKIPLISVDNMHIITQTQIEYPPNHQQDLLVAKAVIKSYIMKAQIHILTSFFYPKIRPNKKAIIYPPVLRDEILKLKPSTEDHLLVYQTSSENKEIINMLKKIDENFIIYGYNKEKKDENLNFKKFSEADFFKDIASSKAIICNGGFTTITEAIHLKKPIYSIPAQKNFEQILNGFYVNKLGYGEYHKFINNEKIHNFLDNIPIYQKKLNKNKSTNNDGILKEIEYRIEKYSKK